jgi:hypothetical protein
MVLNFSGWLAGWLAGFPKIQKWGWKRWIRKGKVGRLGGWGGGGKKKEGIKLGTKHRVNFEYKNR